MGSRNHEARDAESPKAPDAGGAAARSSAESARGRSAEPDVRAEAGATTEAAPENSAASALASETRPSQPAPRPSQPAPRPSQSVPRPSQLAPDATRAERGRADSEPDEIEPHVAISFGFDGEGVPPSSGPISRPNIAGRYRLDKRLAEGGMGIVYAGWHVTLDQPVAIKVIQKDLINNAEAVKRFIEEARALAQLRGPHVAQVLDAGIEDGTPFIVMELLKGRDLRTLLGEQERMPVTLAVQLVREACEAVSEAHAKGIVHRDLKPENLFLAEAEHGGSLLKVIDFGISARQGADGGYDQDAPGPGSPEYMAPEQLLRGAAGDSTSSVDHRADIWSLGIVLYELLTGNVPFSGETPHAICSAVVAAPPPSLRRVRPEVPLALEAVVLRCLHKSPGQRFSDAQELAHALSAFEPAPVELLPSMRVSARPPRRTELRDEWDVADSLAPAQVVRRSTGNWRVGVGVLVGCVLGVVGYFATRSELGPAGASGGSSGVAVAPGGEVLSERTNQGPIVTPVTDTPNVLPILGDSEQTPVRRRPVVPGPLLPAPAAALNDPDADESIEAELDHVGKAVAGLVADAPRSEEEVVEARYALAASKPKASAEPAASPPQEPPITARPAPDTAEPKAPARAAFPDAVP